MLWGFYWQGDFKSFANIHFNWIHMTSRIERIRCSTKRMKIQLLNWLKTKTIEWDGMASFLGLGICSIISVVSRLPASSLVQDSLFYTQSWIEKQMCRQREEGKKSSLKPRPFSVHTVYTTDREKNHWLLLFSPRKCVDLKKTPRSITTTSFQKQQQKNPYKSYFWLSRSHPQFPPFVFTWYRHLMFQRKLKAQWGRVST